MGGKIIVEFPEGKTFLNTIKSVNSVNASARFMFRKDYIEIREFSIDMDSYIDVFIPVNALLMYEIDHEHDVVIEPNEMINALKGVGHQPFKLMVIDDIISISNGTYTYNFKVKSYEKSYEYEDDLKFKHNVMFEMYSDEFKNIIDIIYKYTSMRYYDKFVINVQDNDIRIKTEDDNINIHVKPIRINVIENSTSKYNIKELHRVIQHLSKIYKTIEVKFSTEQPLELSINYLYKIKYLLAPMI
ncbi:MAG: hypothetical protein QXW20_08880 [Ignisphaera sp.]